MKSLLVVVAAVAALVLLVTVQSHSKQLTEMKEQMEREREASEHNYQLCLRFIAAQKERLTEMEAKGK